MRTITDLARQLATGAVTSRALVEECLARIEDPAGEGRRTFLKTRPDEARAAATYYDTLRKHGGAWSPYAGIPVSIKDLFDIAGDVTTAGSVVLRNQPAAVRDADAVARLRAAGFILIGRTNMTEFAYSGLGINPHYDTPRNPYDRKAGRVPGGSSSGAAVSVTDGMAFAGLGTDTGGSCRIPAALCGIVGYKPTARRVSTLGAVPLSTTLDSIGPLAATVDCCDIIDGIMSGTSDGRPPQRLRDLRFAVPQTLVFDNIEPQVAAAFEASVKRLQDGGVTIERIPLKELQMVAEVSVKGGISAGESLAYHRPFIAAGADQYDPRVIVRIRRGEEQNAADFLDLFKARAAFIAAVNAATADFDGLIMPTTPLVAPTLSSLEGDDAYTRANLLMLRNPSLANVLDRCAISLPCHAPGEAPVGMMVIAPTGMDDRLFAIARVLEPMLSRQ